MPTRPPASRIKTRLDPVVRFRERKERLALEGLARATDEVGAARARLVLAQQQAQADGRSSGVADHWLVAEAARERALIEVKRAHEQVQKSATAADAAASAWRTEHQQTEGVRRVADARRAEAIKAQDRRDTRELDALGALMFWRRPA